MNDDRISELYKGEILSQAAQGRARRRINWLVAHAKGERILDVGCSQGIAAILLGREGFEVVGIDVQRSRIDYALGDLAKEEADTRARVTFETGNGAELPFADDSFGTVLLGEVLEHLSQPSRVLSEAIRVAGPEGTVLVTTPVGLHPHDDHKQTFRPRDVIDLFLRTACIQQITIVDGYFRAVLRNPDIGGMTQEEALRSLDEPLAEMLLAVQEKAFDAHKAERAAARRKIELQRELQRRTEEHKRRVEELTSDVQGLQSKIRTSSSQWTEERDQLTKHIIKMQGELKKLQGRSARVTKLEQETLRTRYERDLVQWKYRALRARKWWRIGVALGTVRRQPLAALKVIANVVRIALGPSRPTAPRPPRPAGLTKSRSEAVEGGKAAEPPMVADASPKPARRVVAATALDTEVERQFSFEWVSQPVTSGNWSEVLHEASPDFLIVSDSGWEEHPGDATAGSPLWEIVNAFCKAGIPTVYWDTRRLHLLEVQAEMARAYDVIVCSFPETVEVYHSLGFENVHLFTPSVQTRLFSPVLEGRGRGDVVLLHSATASKGKNAAISEARKTSFPSSTHGEVENRELSGGAGAAIAAKGYKTAVVEFSRTPDETEIRRLLEVVATKTPLVVGGVIPEELSQAAVGAETRREVDEILRTLLQSDGLREQLSHRAWRHVRQYKSISHRVDQLLAVTGVANPSPFPKLTFMVPTNRPQSLEAILDNLGRQTYPRMSAVLVSHGFRLDVGHVREMAFERGLEEIEVLHVSEDVALGEVFNRGFAACDGDYLGKMDDDDYYGPDYAGDLMAAYDYTSADIVGKWTHYAYSQALNSTLLRYAGCEHSYQPLLAISTLILRPSILESVSFLPMPRGSGSRFLREAKAEGARIFSGDRFNYLYKRYSGRGHHHTWPMGDYEFAAKAEFVCQGENLAVIDA